MDDDPVARALQAAIVRSDLKAATRESALSSALGVKIGEKIATSPITTTWHVTRELPGVVGAGEESLQDLMMIVLEERGNEKVTDRFAAAAEWMQSTTLDGIARVLAVAPTKDAFTCELYASGTAKDLAVLRWSARRRGEFVRRVIAIVHSIHSEGRVHGCLSPANIELGDALRPVLAEVGLFSVRDLEGATEYEAFAAPEVRDGVDPDVRSDVYSLGCVMRYLVLEGEKKPLEAIADVARRATAKSPAARYQSAAELLDAFAPLIDKLDATENAEEGAERAATAVEKAKREGERERERDLVAAVRGLDKAGQKAATPSKPIPRWIGGFGFLTFAGALVLAYFVGCSSPSVRKGLFAMACVGSAVSTLIVPPQRRRSGLIRFVLFAGVMGLVVTYDPLHYAYRAGALKRMRGSEADRTRALDDLVQLGRDLRGARLSQLHLSDLDLAGSDLRGADLSGSDLARTSLFGAILDGAAFNGAHIEGTDLAGTMLQGALGLGSAECDKTTRFPSGWKCVDGHPASVE